jgi:glycosyltransferase involved in cell wall biosynthesis
MATIFMAAYTNYCRDPRVKREAEALLAEGHRVVFMACRQTGEPRRATIAGVEVIRTRALPGKPDSFAAYLLDYAIFFFFLAFHLTLHPLRYRLIHINNMPDFLVFAAWLPRLLGRPVIHDIHDLMPEIYMEKFRVGERHWVIRLLFSQENLAARFASAVLTVEDRLRDILVNRGIARSKISVLINLPDERIFAPRAVAFQKPSDAPFVMVYHGTLARRLGLDIAIQAISKLRTRIPRMEFHIIGAGEERERLLALRDKLGLRDVVTFSEGFVPVEEIPQRLQDADVGLVPLRVSIATDIMLPTKLLEYVQLGIPCITPRTRTIARYFDNEMVSFFVSEDSDSLADAIADLYQHPEKRLRMCRQATEKFLSKYCWSRHKNVYTDLVRKLLTVPGGNA